jgi:quinoprotein glucose dehydrogenase
VLNRKTGEPLIPVEEKPVPKGDVPTEWYSPTQPIPVRPPALARTSFSEADLVTADDTTPEHAEACRDLMKRSGGFYNAGPFTPFGYKAPDAPPKSTIQFPGGTGGVNWGGVAAGSDDRHLLRRIARWRARGLGAGQGSERHVQLRGSRLEAAV